MIHGIYRHYSICPVCGNNEHVFMNKHPYCITIGDRHDRIGMEPKTARYGYQKGLPFWQRLSTDKHYWCISHFYCEKCGCEWDSPEFPLFEVPYGYKDFMWHGRLLRTDEFLA